MSIAFSHAVVNALRTNRTLKNLVISIPSDRLLPPLEEVATVKRTATALASIFEVSGLLPLLDSFVLLEIVTFVGAPIHVHSPMSDALTCSKFCASKFYHNFKILTARDHTTMQA